jgi:hypothetical protein
MRKIFLTLTALLSIALLDTAFAQLRTPAPSPAATLTQAVGVTDIAINYSRPGVRGRNVFGELVPYGEVWRTGANESTKISFSTDVSINGQQLPAGKYALYTIPNKEEWTVIFSKSLENWGSDGYKQEQDALRVNVKPGATTEKVETFTIAISEIKNDGANLDIMWENTRVRVPFTLDVDAQVMANMDKALAEAKPDDWRTLAQAATYLFQNGKDINRAAELINKSVSIKEQFWTRHAQSEILAKKGDIKGAIAAANRGLELAKEAKNNFYVSQIEKNLNEWQAKNSSKGKGKKKS